MGLDDDFNLRRLERYLSLVLASDVEPIVVLSKADIAAADPVRRDAQVARLRERLPAGVEVVIVDGTDPDSAASFAHLTGFGQTLVVLGSSGAGKSTLTNTLLGAAVQDTGAVRVHDGRGMHTTTVRSLHRLPAAPASSTRPACARCAPTPTPTRCSPASPTSRRCRRAAASAIARTPASRAVRCVRASTRIDCTTSRRCCARTGATA